MQDYVELPEDAQDRLWFSNVLCGAIRGALEMIQIQVDAHFVSDRLVNSFSMIFNALDTDLYTAWRPRDGNQSDLCEDDRRRTTCQ